LVLKRGIEMPCFSIRTAAISWVSVAVCFCLAPPRAVPAEPAAGDEASLETITVNAQKRVEKLEDVPITVNAFDATELQRSGIESVNDLGTVVPGLVYADVVGYGLPYLRGVGTTATGPGFENPVATYVDGVYYASQGAAALTFNNIASVEVDKGPQGTLFGRNTTGGAIQITTLDPSRDFGGKVEVGYGNYDTVTTRGYVTGALASNLAADLAFNYSDQGDGYGKNLANGADVDKTDDLGLRSKLLYTPGDATRMTLILDYTRVHFIPTLAPAPGTTPQFDPPLSSNPRDVYGSPQPWGVTTQMGISMTIAHELASATFTSITAFRNTLYESLFDSTMTAVPGTLFYLVGEEPHRQASQEFQLASHAGGPIDWVSGAYLYWERAGYLDPTFIGGSSFDYFGIPHGILQAPDDKSYSAALYGQGTYHFTPATALTLGLRYTDEYKNDEFVQTIPDFFSVTTVGSDRNFTNLSWRMALQHSFDDDLMGYFSYNRGYKSGGFNDGVPFQPERLDAFEVGEKAEFLNQRVRLNTSLFYYLYDNIQTVTYPNGSLDVTNGGRARLYGLDFDTEMAVTTSLKLSLGFEALEAKYTSFPDASFSVPIPVIPYGQPGYGGPTSGGTTYITKPGGAYGYQLPKAPKFTGTLAADYSTLVGSAKVAFNATYSYDSGWYGESDNRLHQPAYGLLNSSLSVGTADDGWVLKLWGKNLTDKLYAAFLASETNGDEVQWAPPRTYGFTVTRKF
jgi:iron complex outermembrane receptor protein